jgi:hypothetical protein
MIRITFRRVREGEEERLRAWMQELNGRSHEVRETFRQEGVRHEAAYLLQTLDGPILVYAVEAPDFHRAHEAYADSTLPIDREHAEVMRAVLGHRAPAELLYSCDLHAAE